ncbi:hypothetical protein B0H63DRAFT_316061 [Podospora didyma]|uniref:Uncharacterized protein n=1 Tax=Podospora didyma TaxID=330526 RepID=A0AAE0K6N5_9PEZI|nr:hypothetical protein B0H63DRAFT_316061 [Podospora didyma]
MCCGESSSTTPRVGARVDFFSRTQGNVGNLFFVNPSEPSSLLATHVRFSPRDGMAMDDRVLVSIHLNGDLSKPVEDSGLFQRFTLPRARRIGDDAQGLEIALGQSLALEVGDDGIIGRRVSMTRGDELLADGIVGFNMPMPVLASL